jgi:hypothetical protein
VDGDDAIAEAVDAGELARQFDDAADLDGVDAARSGLTGEQAENACSRRQVEDDIAGLNRGSERRLEGIEAGGVG